MTSVEQDEDRLKSRLKWLLGGLTLMVYWKVSSYNFVNYDDPVFVSSNPHVYSGLSFANFIWSLTTLNGGATSYQPLVWLTHQLDCQLFGLRAGPHHLTNLFFHVVNTALLFTLLEQVTRKIWRSAIVSALFALHPLHVETVAWVSERKTLVCVFFWMLTLLAYVRYTKERSIRRYMLVLVLFGGALLSKPIAVSLPVTLLLLDHWPLERWSTRMQWRPGAPAVDVASSHEYACSVVVWSPGASTGVAALRAFLSRPLIIEKVPMFIMSGVVSVVTLIAQNDLGATKSLDEVPMNIRLNNSVVACFLYLRKMIWPADLAPSYLLRHDWVWWEVAGSALFLLAISAWVFSQARKRGYLIVGWLWFFVTLLPTLGFVQVGSQGMADRYSYVPLIGIFLLLVWSVPNSVTGNTLGRALVGAGTATLICTFAVCTIATVRYWQDSLSLFQHAVRVTTANYIAYCQLGSAFGEIGALSEAERLFRESLAIKPNQFIAYLDLGDTLRMEGDESGAVVCYFRAATLNPLNPGAHDMIAQLFFGARDSMVHDVSKALNESRLACDLSHYRNRRLLEHLSTICIENHELRDAREAAQKALALCVTPGEAEKDRQLLADISRVEAAENTGVVGQEQIKREVPEIVERLQSTALQPNDQAYKDPNRQ